MEDLDVISRLVGKSYELSFMTQAGQKSVYRAKSSNDDLVIKVVAIEEFDEDGDIVPLGAQEERLRRELRLMESVESSYLPKLGSIPLAEHSINGLRHLLFSEEYIGDNNLKDLIKANAITPVILKQLAHDIASALVAYDSFENGFVHRDIKPANIMQSNTDGSFILIDGGIHLLPSNPTITSSNVFIGTQRYASPEQLLSGRRSTDPRSDIYSLGIVLYEAATGTHPFYIKGADPQACFINQTQAKFQPINDDEYLVFNPLIKRMITQYQHSRFNTPDELFNNVEGLTL